MTGVQPAASSCELEGSKCMEEVSLGDCGCMLDCGVFGYESKPVGPERLHNKQTNKQTNRVVIIIIKKWI